jgi:phosphatidylinositol glycan class F
VRDARDDARDARVLGACAWFVAAGALAGSALGAGARAAGAARETARGTWRASRALSATTTTAFALARGDGDGDGDETTVMDAFRRYGKDARRVFVRGDARTAREASARAAALGSAAGAWCGACATALDWDRAWLKWPNSVLRGIELGHLVGACAACAYVVLADVLGLDPRVAAKTTTTTKASRRAKSD